MSKTNIAWVTGASSGIGEALTKKLAAEGWHVAISARSEDKLKTLEKAGSIKAYPADTANLHQVENVIQAIEKDLGPINLAVLNAGTYFPDSAEDFKAETLKKQYEVNVFGTMNCVEPVLQRFLKRNAGHIAIVSSIAGYRGLPRSLSYGSSKAALINFCEALAAETQGTGVKVQLVCPGFVKTPLTDKNDFPMPMRMEVENAAAAFMKGLKSNEFEITFPWLFCYLTKLVGLLPNRAYIWVISKIKDKQKRAPNH